MRGRKGLCMHSKILFLTFFKFLLSIENRMNASAFRDKDMGTSVGFCILC